MKKLAIMAILVGFGYPVSAWSFNDLTQDQKQKQKQLQLQGQAQQMGQQQGNIGINKSKNINKNKNINDNNNNASANSRSKSKGIGIGLGVGKASNKGNTNNITIGGDEGDDFPASSAYASNLIATKCWGSTGIGGQGMTFGFTVNSTWKDTDCLTLRNAAAIAGKRDAKGNSIPKHMAAAHAIECMITEIREAYKLTGSPCPQDLAEAKAAQGSAAKYYRDPASGKIVRLETGAKMPIHRVALVPLDNAPGNVIWNDDKHTVALHTAAE